jgi:hypothetical protein
LCGSDEPYNLIFSRPSTIGTIAPIKFTKFLDKNQNSVIDHGSELFGDNTTKQDGELEINNANFTISAVLCFVESSMVIKLNIIIYISD